MFKFQNGQKVKVRVINVVKEGKVVSRELYDTEHVSRLSYTVKYGGWFHDTITVTEEDLVAQQNMPLGIVHK